MVLHWTKQRNIAWRNEAFSEHQTPHLRPVFFRWLEFPNMREGRTDFGIAWTNGGRLFYVGGQTGPNKSTQSVEMLRCPSIDSEPISNDTWSFVAPLTKPRQSHGVAFIDQKIVVAGGLAECGVEYFTLPTGEDTLGQWTSIYPLPEPLNIIALLPVDNCLIGIGSSKLN